MKPSLRRRLAASLTLAALVFSLAETAQASRCVHGKVAQTTEASHGSHNNNTEHTPSHEQGTACPLGLTAGCTVSSSFVTTFDFAVLNAEGSPIVIPAASTGVDRILISAAFHPPRA